ncbi:hypothetical protein FQN50_008775 [Emmonsiellopsis sp. PD_5]|nr:hypothetical protein FQN50_008775 [Emmonsiellopsis sp. PD_5]
MDNSAIRTPVTIKAQGIHYKEDTHRDLLLEQLKNIPRDINDLDIDDNAPSDAEWSILGAHFTNVTDLALESGYDEMLNDKEIPQHWPLKSLFISSACAELVQSPFILEGNVNRLVLFFTSSLRFEGPTTDELCKANKEAIARGEEEERFVTVDEGKPEERKISVVSVPSLVQQWISNKYVGSTINCEVPGSPTVNLETLEIIENDAMDTLVRMALALPHIVFENLKTINIRSTNGCEYPFCPEDMFGPILSNLRHLKTLVLTVGQVFDDDANLFTLHNHFPPNISTLRFRGPVSIAKSAQWHEWVDSFSDPECLPNLKKLSFVLDMDFSEPAESEQAWVKKRRLEASEESLREAKAACNQLYEAARNRGISVEPFWDHFSSRSKQVHQVDERWEEL